MGAGSILLDMGEAEYHSRPELSSTEARLILDAPAKYRWKKDHPPLVTPSKKFDIGSAVHSKVLGTGYEAVPIPDEMLSTNGAVSTKAAKEFVAKVRAEGKIPLKSSEFEPIAAGAEAVLAHPIARALFGQGGSSEVSVFATDPETGVPCRARFDYLPPLDGRVIAVDLKTAADASKRAFEKSVASYEYGVQRGWYLDTLGWAVGPFDVNPELVFVVVEKEPPYMVAVYQIPRDWAEKGHKLAAIARRTYAACMDSGVWPGLPDEVQLLDEPNWHVYEIEERFGV